MADLLGDPQCLVPAMGVREEHEDLVAAHPSHEVLPADAVGDATRQFHENGVAGGVPERVVDVLEPVDVAEDHGQFPTRVASVAMIAWRRVMASARFMTPVRVSKRASRSSFCSAAT